MQKSSYSGVRIYKRMLWIDLALEDVSYRRHMFVTMPYILRYIAKSGDLYLPL
jgi:hypothetical protein